MNGDNSVLIFVFIARLILVLGMVFLAITLTDTGVPASFVMLAWALRELVQAVIDVKK